MTEGVSEITRRKRCSARGGMSVREASIGSREKISSTEILIWKSTNYSYTPGTRTSIYCGQRC